MKSIFLFLTGVLYLFSIGVAAGTTNKNCNGNNDNCYQGTGSAAAKAGASTVGQTQGKGGSSPLSQPSGGKGAGGKGAVNGLKSTGRAPKSSSAKGTGLQRRDFAQLFTQQPYFEIIESRATTGGSSSPYGDSTGAGDGSGGGGSSGASQGQSSGQSAQSMDVQDIVQMINNNERLPAALQPLVTQKAKELGLNPPDPSTQKPTPSHLQGHPSTQEIQMLQSNNIPPAIVQAAKAQWGGGGSSQMSSKSGGSGSHGQSSAGGLGGGSQSGAISRRYTGIDADDYGFGLSGRDLDDDLELYIRGFEGEDFDMFVRDLPNGGFNRYERGIHDPGFYAGYNH